MEECPHRDGTSLEMPSPSGPLFALGRSTLAFATQTPQLPTPKGHALLSAIYGAERHLNQSIGCIAKRGAAKGPPA